MAKRWFCYVRLCWLLGMVIEHDGPTATCGHCRRSWHEWDGLE